MRTWLLTGATTVLATAAAWAMVSSPPKPLGEWKIADGTANVSIRTCGPDLCGFVSWAKESSAPLGREVLIDMKQNGHSWFGTAVNVVNGEQYTARMSLEGLYVPTLQLWYPAFRSELLSFPAGKHDDQVDALGLVGQLLDLMIIRQKSKSGEPLRGTNEMTMSEAWSLAKPRSQTDRRI